MNAHEKKQRKECRSNIQSSLFILAVCVCLGNEIEPCQQKPKRITFGLTREAGDK